MRERINKKLFHICMIIIVVSAVIFGVATLIIRYQVEGETNLPFEITKVSIISSIDGKDNSDEINKWNINVNQNNDVYIYLDKNNNYDKTEIIDSIVIENFSLSNELKEGKTHIYKPTETSEDFFENTSENIIEQLIYEGDLESNIKSLKISNQGGLVVFRIANDNIATYISNDAEQVDYSKLLQDTNVKYEDIKTDVNFDLTIKLTSGKSFKTNLTLHLPIEGIIEDGKSSNEITETKNFVFKRVENN